MRKWGKIILLTFALTVVPGGTLLYAASSSSGIAVYLNNVLQKQPGIESEGEAYLSVQQLSENMNVLLTKENSGKTVRIYKPNVNTVLLDDQGRIFGKVKSAGRNTFSVLVQVDNLKTEITDIKITITDPADKTETIDTHQVKEQKENFWFISGEYTYTFSSKGTYAVRVYVKDKDSKKWTVVSELQAFTI